MIRDTSDQDIQIEKTAAKGRRLLICCAVALSLFGAVSAYPAFDRWNSSSMTVSQERLRFDTVIMGDFLRDVSVQGQIVAAVRPVLYSPENGRVSLAVRAGDRVSIGQTLATVDSPELDNRYQQELSTLEGMKAQLLRQQIQTRSEKLDIKQSADLGEMDVIAAARELRRAKIAFDRNAISLQDFEKAGDDHRKVELQLRNIKASQLLDHERLDLELKILMHTNERQRILVTDLKRQVAALVILSPVDGVVGNLEVEEKAIVSRYQAILNVLDLSAYEVAAGIPENYADELAIGMEVEISYNGKVYRGSLAAISPEVLQGRVQSRIRFSGKRPDKLRQNQRVSSRILIDQRKQIMSVRRGNFLQAGAGKTAYVLRDGVAEKTAITIGATSASRVEIIAGVEVGDTLVIAGADFFDDQDHILISE